MTRGQVYAGKAVILIEALDKVDATLRTVENKFKRMGNNLSALGKTTFTGGFFATLGQSALISRFTKFDDLILTLRVKMGLLSNVSKQQEMEFAKLEKRIRSLGKSTSFTTIEVAEGAVRLAQAGFSGLEIEDTLQAVLDLARGTSTDLGNAARVLANTIRTFNLETKDAESIVSMFVRATRSGTLDIDDLAESLKYASATAVTLGQSLPEVLAIFALLSDKGMRGSISGTSLNTALNQIARKKDDIKAAYGFDVPVDEGGNLMFVDFLKLLIESTSAMDKLNKSGDFGSLFNLRGMRSILPISNERDIKRLIETRDAIASASDEARIAAEIMDSGLGGAFRRAASAVDDLIISLGKLQGGPLASLAGMIPSITALLDKLITKYQSFTLLLAASPAIALAAGIGMIVIGKSLQTVAMAIGSLRSLGGGAAGLVKKSLGVKGINALANGGGKYGSKVFGKLGQFPTGAASALPSAAGAMKPKAYHKYQEMISAKIAIASKEVAVTEKAAAQAAIVHRAAIANATKSYQELNIARQAEVVAAAKNLVNIKATNIGIAKHNALYKAQLETGKSIFKLEQELVKVQSAKAFWQAKLQQRVASGAETAVVANAGNKIKALIATEKSIQSSIQMQGMAMGPVLSSILKPLDESAAMNRLIATKQAAAGAKTAASQQMIARVVKANQTADASMAAKGLAQGRLASLTKMAGSAKLAGKAPILPQVLSGIGKAGGMVKNIATLAGSFLKLGMAVSKFVFSLNGILLLFTFGDRIPVIKDILSNLSNAFGAAFGQIGGIFKALAPAMDYFMASFDLLGNADTQDIGFENLVQSIQLMGEIVQGKLIAAWGAFKKELSWTYDAAKMVLGTMWELFKVVYEISVSTIGNVIGNTLDVIEDQIGNIFATIQAITGLDNTMSNMDIFKTVLTGLATIVAELFNWVGYAIIQFNNLLAKFNEDMELMLYRVIAALPFSGGTATQTRGVLDRRSEREAQQAKDLGANETAMVKFRQALDQLYASNAYKEGDKAIREGLEKAGAAGAEAMRRMGLMQQQLVPQMSSGTATLDPVPTSQRRQEEIQMLMKNMGRFTATLVGSAAGTRGNVSRAVTKEEIKEQTAILKDIRDELALQNEREGNVFRP
jgi:TP901 family phage tail tape measure protein